uniref:Peptidase A1 domain-containing protein n=1 Tax=Setaria viridis TaxID=4556 RepID=A0A4U6UMJ6_SETVI|nr:hypothetical protein SEVIR_5G217500v2 [Setaria viridis]
MASRMASITGVLLLLLVVPSSSSHVKFDLHGNIYPGGCIYVSMRIGDQVYNLDVDTGSILTWLQCHIPNCQGPCKTQHPLYKLKYDKLVPSMDPLCVELIQHPGNPEGSTCEYSIDYVEGVSHGLLIRDKFTLPIARTAHHIIPFGCGYNQQGFKPCQNLPVDGIIGLGRGSSVNLAFQLKKQNVIKNDVISHCISIRGGGFLFIGDYKHPNNVEWVTMDRNAEHGHYSPVLLGELFFNGKWISEKPMKVVFDSGSTYTYFDRQPYKATEDAVIGSLHKSLTTVRDNEFKLCWKGTKIFNSVDDVKPLFKPIFLTFGRGGAKGHKATLDIPPENYLVIKDGNVCFGILDHPRLGETNLIGAITMQERTVIYDNEAGRIGWVRDSCKGKSGSVIPSRL